MKKTISLSLATLCLLTITVSAPQAPDTGAQVEAMKKLAFLAGKWKGQATMQMGTQRHRIVQTEDVQMKLDGLVLLVEGLGKDPESGRVLHSALATISYDSAAKVTASAATLAVAM